MPNYAIYPDKCAINLFMFPHTVDHDSIHYEPNNKLFEYIAGLPCKTLVIIPQVKKHIESMFQRMSMSRKERKCSLDKLDMVKTSSIDKEEVKSFFEDYLSRNSVQSNFEDIRMVSSDYKSLVVDVGFNHAEKPLIIRPEREDERMLADILASDAGNKKKYFLSVDGHFSMPNIGRCIEERFGVRPGYPSDILAAIKSQ
jgi:hypothetical protein